MNHFYLPVDLDTVDALTDHIVGSLFTPYLCWEVFGSANPLAEKNKNGRWGL